MRPLVLLLALACHTPDDDVTDDVGLDLTERLAAGATRGGIVTDPAALRPLPPAQLVLGDCNATPWNHTFVQLLASTGLQLATVGGWRATWTTSLPWPLRIPIDHILCSPGIGVAATRLGPDLGSDHLPVIADLLVPATR